MDNASLGALFCQVTLVLCVSCFHVQQHIKRRQDEPWLRMRAVPQVGIHMDLIHKANIWVKSANNSTQQSAHPKFGGSGQYKIPPREEGRGTLRILASHVTHSIAHSTQPCLIKRHINVQNCTFFSKQPAILSLCICCRQTLLLPNHPNYRCTENNEEHKETLQHPHCFAKAATTRQHCNLWSKPLLDIKTWKRAVKGPFASARKGKEGI